MIIREHKQRWYLTNVFTLLLQTIRVLGVTSIPKLSQITGKDRFGGWVFLHLRVIFVKKWHYRNNIAKILTKQKEKPKKGKTNLPSPATVLRIYHFRNRVFITARKRWRLVYCRIDRKISYNDNKRT